MSKWCPKLGRPDSISPPLRTFYSWNEPESKAAIFFNGCSKRFNSPRRTGWRWWRSVWGRGSLWPCLAVEIQQQQLQINVQYLCFPLWALMKLRLQRSKVKRDPEVEGGLRARRVRSSRAVLPGNDKDLHGDFR